jgi:RNA recognition motif-containing protein
MYQGPVTTVMSSVFVRNLPTNITEGQLRSLFSRNGIPVTSIKMDKGTQIPTATVYFERRDQAAMAEDLDGWEIGRNRIKVSIMDEARQQSVAFDEPTPRVRRKGRGFADARAEERPASYGHPSSASNDPHKHVSIFDRLT